MTAPSPGAPDARRVDLHMHSTASDGALAPAAVVDAAHRAKLSAIALTDHDSISGVPEARAAGDRLGVRVIAGVELSVIENEREVHLLGLHLQQLDAIDARLAEFRATRRTRAEQIVTKLNSLGIPVTLDAVLKEAGTGAIGRPHVARAMIAGSWVRDFKDAFDRYLGNGRVAYVPKHRLEMRDAIVMIHDAGGLAVVAHPGPEGRRDRLEPLAAQGLDGVEILHPGHSAEDIARIRALADHLRLVPSGGSDWHGASEGARTIGNMNVPWSYLAAQEARLAERAARERVA